MFRSLLFIQAAKAQPPAQATRPPHTLKGRALPAGAPLILLSGGDKSRRSAMSRGLPSMTALLGLLASRATRIGTRSPKYSVDFGRISPEPTVKAALVACLASWVSAAPAPEGSSVVGSASLPIASSKVVSAKPRSPGSTPAPTNRAQRPNFSRRSAPKCWTLYRSKQVYRERSSLRGFAANSLMQWTSTPRKAVCRWKATFRAHSACRS